MQNDILKIIRGNSEEVKRGVSRAFFLMPKAEAAAADLAMLRAKVTDLVARNAIAMVQCAIDGVKEEGQYQAIKYLFEMVGLYPSVAEAESNADEPLARILLQRLDLEEESASAAAPKC